MTFDSFCKWWLHGVIRAFGNPFFLQKKREELKEYRKGATDATLLALEKMEGFLDAVDFRGAQQGPAQADLHAWLGELIPGWRAAHFDDEYELAVETVYTKDPVAHMLVSEPVCEDSLEFLAGAPPGQVRSLFFAVVPASTQVWASLLEIIAGWGSLESIGLSHFFFGSDTDIEFVSLLVERLEVKQLVLYGAVVQAVGPDFFEHARVHEFVFPQTVRYESNAVSFPLLEDSSLAETSAFFENLPAKKVTLKGEDWDWDGLLPLSDDPLVAVLDALKCTEVALDGVKAVGSNLELLRLLFGAGKFTYVGIFGEHLSLSDRGAMWQLVAANSVLRCFEVDFLEEFSRVVLQASLSIRSFAFSKLSCNDPTFYEPDLLQSEVVSVRCRSFDPRALALCASFEKETELAEQRARCLLSCCLQLAPEAHNHIVPSVGAVPVPVMQYAVEHAGKLWGAAEEKGATSRPGKRKLDSGGDQV